LHARPVVELQVRLLLPHCPPLDRVDMSTMDSKTPPFLPSVGKWHHRVPTMAPDAALGAARPGPRAPECCRAPVIDGCRIFGPSTCPARSVVGSMESGPAVWSVRYTSVEGEAMRGWNRPTALAVGTFVAVTLGAFVTYGVGGVLVLAVVAMFVGSYLADRYVVVHMDEHYPRHGDRMD
jgi:hypothetical protein